MQNDDLAEPRGPAIIQVKGCLNLSYSYMTAVCHPPFLFFYISGFVGKQITERNRIIIA